MNAYQLGKSAPEVHLPSEVRPIIGRTLMEYLRGCDHRVLVVAVTKVHAHVLVELPDNIVSIKAIIGHAKRRASRAVKSWFPGSIWARGGTYKAVTSREHHRKRVRVHLVRSGSQRVDVVLQ